MTSKGPSIKLNSEIICDSTPPYIIAEIGVNHEGLLEKAMELIELATKGGPSAVKFQTYKAEKLASKHSPAYWDLTKEPTTSQYELFKKFDKFGEKEFELLAEHCRKVGIDFMSTPFDSSAVDFLSSLVSCFKVASADITNFPMLRQIGKKGKPVLISTGAATLAEIEMAISELVRSGCEKIALLHCVLNYPTPYKNAHINMIKGLRQAFPDHVVGYSDHTLPDRNMIVLTGAYLKGARIIEKHFTHDKSLPGNDHYHAMDINDLKQFKSNLELLFQVEGETDKIPLDSEAPARLNTRRSIVLQKSIQQGTILTEEMLTCKRPGSGISPIHWDEMIGQRVVRDLAEDEILEWDAIKAK